MSADQSPGSSPKTAPPQPSQQAPRPPGKPGTIQERGADSAQQAQAPRPPGKPSTIQKKGIG